MRTVARRAPVQDKPANRSSDPSWQRTFRCRSTPTEAVTDALQGRYCCFGCRCGFGGRLRLPVRVARVAGPYRLCTARRWSWPVQNPAFTSGAVIPGCTYPRPASQRNVTAATKRRVAAEYRYTGPTARTAVEFDHLIPFSLCGADTAANIWPEPVDGTKQTAYIANAKDELEDAIASKVRYGKMTLAQGQDVFRHDWRVEWCLYIKHATGMC